MLGQWLSGLDPKAASRSLGQLNQTLLQRAAAGEAEVLDPGFESWPDDHWNDAMHFSAHGSQRFAEALAGWLAESMAGGESEADSASATATANTSAAASE